MMVKPIHWTPELVDKFWSSVAQTRLAELSFSRHNSERLIELIQGYLKPQGRHLDFGAGDGDLLRALIQKGYATAAYEPVQARASRFPADITGHPKYLGQVRDGGPERFDVVLMIEVVEHILEQDLAGVFRQVKSLLTDHGTLIVTTPNAEDLELAAAYCPQCETLFHRWQHQRSFTLESLPKFLGQHGFECLGINEVDFSNLNEEIETMWRREQRSLFARLKRLLTGQRVTERAHLPRYLCGDPANLLYIGRKIRNEGLHDASVLTHPDGDVQVEKLLNGRRRLTVHLANTALFMPSGSCETSYPLDLIQAILGVKGPAYLCDEILRDENDAYVRLSLERDLRAYFDLAWFDGKRLLDFGCGAGASTMSLAKLFPRSQIVGIEVLPRHLSLAQRRLQHYGFPYVTFRRSSSSLELPPDIGWFDCVMLSAVYEHMLPHERAQVLPTIWSVIRPGGFLFINQTPHRHFPYESHTTGLPFINYLPDALALAYARACSKRVRRNESWESLLRDGIRGATEQEILGILSSGGAQEAVLLEPCQEGLRDRIDLWHSSLGKTRYRKTKRLLKGLLAAIKTLSGVTLVPNLSLVIQKTPHL